MASSRRLPQGHRSNNPPNEESTTGSLSRTGSTIVSLERVSYVYFL